jgi:hypothetical protein
VLLLVTYKCYRVTIGNVVQELAYSIIVQFLNSQTTGKQCANKWEMARGVSIAFSCIDSHSHLSNANEKHSQVERGGWGQSCEFPSEGGVPPSPRCKHFLGFLKVRCNDTACLAFYNFLIFFHFYQLFCIYFVNN